VEAATFGNVLGAFQLPIAPELFPADTNDFHLPFLITLNDCSYKIKKNIKSVVNTMTDCGLDDRGSIPRRGSLSFFFSWRPFSHSATALSPG
jgi:hypothetical protein